MLENQKGILKEFFVNRMCMSFGCLGGFVREVGCLWGWGVGGFGYLFFVRKRMFSKNYLFSKSGKTMTKSLFPRFENKGEDMRRTVRQTARYFPPPIVKSSEKNMWVELTSRPLGFVMV